MWQSFLDWFASSSNSLLQLAAGLTFFIIVYGLFNKNMRQGILQSANKSEFIFGIILGTGLTVMVLSFLHSNNKLTVASSPGDYLECKKCHKSINEIICPYCGEKYSVMPVDELPWKTADSSDY